MSIEHYSVYRLSDGLFTGQQIGIPDVASDPDKKHALSVLPAGCAAKPGRFDHLSKRVDVAAADHPVVAWRPPRPSPDHEWDSTAQRWILSAAAQERRGARIRLLEQIAMLESAQHRAVREILIEAAPDKAERLAQIDADIVKLRVGLT